MTSTPAQASTWRLSLLASGFWILLCSGLLLSRTPETLIMAATGRPRMLLLLMVLVAMLMAGLPFEFMAAKKQLGRQHIPKWWGGWLRASGIWLLLSLIIGLTLLGAADWLGKWGAWGAFGLLIVVLSGFQIEVQRLSSGAKTIFDTDKGRALAILDVKDLAFTGGICGLPGNESLVIPGRWEAPVQYKVKQLLINRRHLIIGRGAHGRGYFLALAWNLAVFALVQWLVQSPPESLGWLLETVCIFSIISPLGYLLLWPLSRLATRETDLHLYHEHIDLDLLKKAAQAVQSHPIDGPYGPWQMPPSENWRSEQLSGNATNRGAWQAAGYAIWFSWAGLNLTARFFPSVLGRPALWAMPPSD